MVNCVTRFDVLLDGTCLFAQAKQREAVQLVQQKRHVFISGCAGSGKSYLLRYLREHLPLNTTFFSSMTGLAALEIDAPTLHSLLGLHYDTRNLSVAELVDWISKRPDCLKLWRAMLILCVDEISMLDGAFFAKLEECARLLRIDSAGRFFGGIQLIFVGNQYCGSFSLSFGSKCLCA